MGTAALTSGTKRQDLKLLTHPIHRRAWVSQDTLPTPAFAIMTCTGTTEHCYSWVDYPQNARWSELLQHRTQQRTSFPSVCVCNHCMPITVHEHLLLDGQQQSFLSIYRSKYVTCSTSLSWLSGDHSLCMDAVFLVRNKLNSSKYVILLDDI
jgi:hypothetical protein